MLLDTLATRHRPNRQCESPPDRCRSEPPSPIRRYRASCRML
jgi:hypothetical protein